LYSGPFTLTASAPVTYEYFSGGVAIGPAATAQYYVNDSGQIGISDAWQVQYFGHTGIDPNADPTNSGLTNLQKYLYGYDPTKFSTNGDGLSDANNRLLGISGGNLDINNYSGLTNAQQLALGLDPFDAGVNPPPATPPSQNPNDTTPPVVTIDVPANAVLLP